MSRVLKCECGTCRRCKHREYMRAYYRRHASANSEGFQRRRDARRIYSSGSLVDCKCEWCEKAFTVTERKLRGAKVRFCSRACKGLARGLALRQARAASKPLRECRHCGSEMDRAMRADAVYCSERCNSAAHHLKRGNGRLGPGRRRDIERAYIIARDQSRCHICGKKCKPREISLDHLIPVSLGGSHAVENLRVAHLSCNVRKRAGAANDQLMLVG